MKIRNLLVGATGLLCVVGASAKDYAPGTWKFSEMPVGSAESIFIKEMASTNWNCKAPFRLADNGNGGVGLACYAGGDVVGPVTDSYANMSEADKATFEEFYKSVQIVNGGSENLLCIIGKEAAQSYPGGVQCPKSFPNATLCWLGGTDMPLNQNYRLTIDYRVITPEENGKISLTLATSAYDGVDAGPSYRQFDLGVYAAYNDYWNRGILDFYMEDNNDPNYKELPLAIKMWLGSLADNSVILFRSFKLETIDAIDDKNNPGNNNADPGFVDNPPTVSVSQTDFNNEVVVWANNGTISIVDAKEPIEIYNAAGVLVSKVNEVSTLVNVPVKEKGLFLVKVGTVTRKVVL